MDEVRGRKWRLEQLLNKQKKTDGTGFGELFEECIESLGAGTAVISEDKSKEIYLYLQKSYSITSWSRIDWGRIWYLRKYPSLKDVISERFDYIFSDEMQDTDDKQQGILEMVIDQEKVVVQRIGDSNQSIFNSSWKIRDRTIPSYYETFGALGGRDLAAARNRQQGHFPELLRNSLFTTCYSSFEVELMNFCKFIIIEKNIKLNLFDLKVEGFIKRRCI